MNRWITGLLLAIGIVLMLFFSPTLYLQLLVVILAMIGCWEFLSIAIPTQSTFEKIIGVLLTAAGVTNFIFLQTQFMTELYWFFILIWSFLTQFPQKPYDAAEKIRRVAFLFLAIAYSAFLFSFLGRLLEVANYRFWVFLLLACTFMADTCAYLVGKSLGKHKLAPTISPGKSIEGLIGGCLGGVIGAWVVKFIFWPEFNPLVITVLGFAIPLVGLLGDLSESLLKRGFGVKDSGNILPGHGGILDRLDALLFNAPWVYFVAVIYYS